ncbi:MAG: HD domain-containing protein, partial [Candidatus Yanofskybacteria bacterium]|nr:HD domain-containing protein [Candidatus Yanofskybacteria bacterium]
EEIQKIFSRRSQGEVRIPTDSVGADYDATYENTFGTVGIKTGSKNSTLAVVEVTPYRIEGKYTDKRHPDEIKFAEKLEDDLSRRDFTINAMALSINPKYEIRNTKQIQNTNSKNSKRLEFKNPDLDIVSNFDIRASNFTLIDLFDGQKDLNKKVIRTVGNPKERFNEDALRLLRAIRFATVLGFNIEEKTLAAVKENAEWIRIISKERIRDEFIKIIESDSAYEGVLLLEETGLLQYVVPEMHEGIGVEQNLHHIYTVWEHCARALKYAADKKYSLEVRLAALFHDIGKPRSKRGEGLHSTFYGHEVIGAKMVAQIMERLKFPKDITEQVVKLVRYHMFFYNVGEVTESSVRRLMANVGKDNMEDLIKVREADRIGSGRPKAVPYKLRHMKYIIDKVSHDPISVKMLQINGDELMKELSIKPGPKIGLILNYLLAEVLNDPTRNKKEYLRQRTHELDKKTPEELRESLKKIEEAQKKEEEARMKKYYV